MKLTLYSATGLYRQQYENSEISNRDKNVINIKLLCKGTTYKEDNKQMFEVKWDLELYYKSKSAFGAYRREVFDVTEIENPIINVELTDIINSSFKMFNNLFETHKHVANITIEIERPTDEEIELTRQQLQTTLLALKQS